MDTTTEYGIATRPILPLRRDKGPRAPLHSQILFGELYLILDRDKNHLRVRLLHDHTTGWLPLADHVPVTPDYAHRYLATPQPLLADLFHPAAPLAPAPLSPATPSISPISPAISPSVPSSPVTSATLLLPAASVLPFLDPSTGHFLLGDHPYTLLPPAIPSASSPLSISSLPISPLPISPDTPQPTSCQPTASPVPPANPSLPLGTPSPSALVIRHALAYHNTPCLPGGRTPLGIDAPALVQQAHRLAGIPVPRFLPDLLAAGQPLAFIDETRPGDLAFFGDDPSSITHVGLILAPGYILHASGHVRVDRLDHHGIFRPDLRRYTHSLRLLTRLT